MEKLIKKLFLALGTAIVAFCVFVFPLGFVPAFADTGEISAKESVVLEEAAEENYPLVYTMIDTNGQTARIELLDEYNMTIVLYLEDGTTLASVNGWYETTENENIIQLYAYDTCFGLVELYEDGTAAYVEETDEEYIESEEGGGVLDGIIPETEASIWFKEKVAPYILEYGAAALGVATGLLVCLFKLRKSIAGVVGVHNALTASNEHNETTKTQVQEVKMDMKEWQARQEEKMAEYFAAQDALMEKRFKEIAQGITEKLDDVVVTSHKILDVEEIAYADNPIMVSKGTAKKIEGVIHNEQKQSEKKTESDG